MTARGFAFAGRRRRLQLPTRRRQLDTRDTPADLEIGWITGHTCKHRLNSDSVAAWWPAALSHAFCTAAARRRHQPRLADNSNGSVSIRCASSAKPNSPIAWKCRPSTVGNLMVRFSSIRWRRRLILLLLLKLRPERASGVCLLEEEEEEEEG